MKDNLTNRPIRHCNCPGRKEKERRRAHFTTASLTPPSFPQFQGANPRSSSYLSSLLLSFLTLFVLQKSKGKEEEISEKSMAESSLKSAALLDQMKLHLASDAGKELTKKIGLVYQLNIAPKKLGVDEEIYVVDLKEGRVTKGPYEGKPDATFSFKDSDFLAVATGKMNPQMAFIRGAMKIKGSISAAQKFTPDIFPKPSKL